MSALDRILEHKKEEVARARARKPLAEVIAEARDADRPRGFLHALASAKTPLALIAEVKKASPSRGVIRPDFDPAQVARSYEEAGAHALSVLTDERFFQGSAENLARARAATSLPCLRKDFLFDPYQIYEARAWSADAVLLIVASLEQSALEDMQLLAEELGMDALVEVHTVEEADRALRARAKLIGVNNRDLGDLTTTLETSERLIPHLLAAGDRLVVSESALESPADLERVRKAGARAVLIGTTFCLSPDIGQKVREVMGW